LAKILSESKKLSFIKMMKDIKIGVIKADLSGAFLIGNPEIIKRSRKIP